MRKYTSLAAAEITSAATTATVTTTSVRRVLCEEFVDIDITAGTVDGDAAPIAVADEILIGVEARKAELTLSMLERSADDARVCEMLFELMRSLETTAATASPDELLSEMPSEDGEKSAFCVM